MEFKTITLRVITLLLLADVIQFMIMFSIKNIALLLAAFHLQDFSLYMFIQMIGIIVYSPYFWLCLMGMVLSFIIWMTVLSSIDLSVAFPLGSLSFIVIPFLSILFLNETIPPLRWLGIIFIVGGIIVLSLGEKQSQERAS